MYHDVHNLKSFYNERALGRVVQRILRDRLVKLWPTGQSQGMTVAGYGYTPPLLRPFLGKARRVTALMPGPQGVTAWPGTGANHAVLCEETAWPLDTGSVDRLIMLHALETADHPSALMDEAWRILGPGGRLVVVVPNRTGLWARSEATPFGIGRSYSIGQLETQASAAGFIAEAAAGAVYIPPSDRRFWLRSAQMWENTGTRISRILVSGLLMVEFSKQTTAPIDRGMRVSVPSPLNVLGGIRRPKPARHGALGRHLPRR